jgi:uncharacterized protein
MTAEKQTNEELYGDAAFAYGEGRFDDAFAAFSQLAEAGNAKAASYVGEMYLRGEGILPDIDIGLEWMQRAASWGNSTAAYNLGALYRCGHYGIEKDQDKSAAFFRLAKELGCEMSVDQYL